MAKQEREKAVQEFQVALTQVCLYCDALREWARITNDLAVPAMQALGEEIEPSDDELEWVAKRVWDGASLPFGASVD